MMGVLEAPPQDTVNTWTSIIKLLKELSSTVILNVLALYGAYMLIAEIRPNLDMIPKVQASLSDARANQTQFYRDYLAVARETLRLGQLQCVAYMETLKRSPIPCQRQAGNEVSTQ